MGTFTPYRIVIYLVCLAAMGAAGRASAASLSDLGAFTQSSREVDRIFTDAKRAKTYREAIQSYASPRGDFSREFEVTLEQLRKLRSQVGGINDRLTKTRKPMAFQYSAPSKPTYRFERISQPLHAIWLLRQLHEANTDACSSRDTLLVDRWTPVLDGASVFSVERDGRYIGITLTLVPVRAVKATYLLVVPNDSASRLPSELLAAFLRDYRKREPKTLPFALLTNPEVSVFQIERVDKDGRAAGRLGPIEGFRLADPLALKIVASVPGWCNRSTSLALGGGGGTSIESGGKPLSTSGGVPVLNPTGPGSVKATAEAKVTVQAPGAVPTGGAQSTYGQTASTKPTPTTTLGGNPVTSRVDNSQRSYRGGDTTIINGVSAPEAAARAGVNPSTVPAAGGTFTPTVPNVAVASPANAPGGGASRGPASIGSGGGGPRGFSGGAAAGVPMGSLEGIDRSKLSAADRKLYDALGASQGALRADKPFDPRGIGEVVRGALDNSTDPKLRAAAKENMSALYFNKNNSLQAYEALEKRQQQRPEEVREMLQALDRDLCKYCADCEYCRGKNGGGG